MESTPYLLEMGSVKNIHDGSQSWRDMKLGSTGATKNGIARTLEIAKKTGNCHPPQKMSTPPVLKHGAIAGIRDKA